MSSYELLELFGVEVIDDPQEKVRTIRVDFPPEDGAVALGIRDGERPEWQEMMAQTANEAAVLRATFAPGAQSDAYDARLFFSQARQRQHAAEAEADAQTVTDEPGGLYSLWQ